MKNMVKRSIGSVVAAGFLFAAGSAFGDVLELKNGTILNGKYVGGTAGTILSD